MTAPGIPRPPQGVSSLFSNAKETAAKTPWANVEVKGSITLGCPACGAPQEVALDFLCRYCRAPMGNRDLPAPSPVKGAQTASGDSKMTPSQQAIVTRWRTFMGKVMTRLRDVLAEADKGCGEMLKNNPADPIPLGNVLGALGIRKSKLDKKLWDTWSKEVSDKLADEAIEREDIPGATELRGNALDMAEAEMKQTLAWMDDTWERFRVKWAAESVRAMWPLADQAMKKPVACTQCGGGLQPRVRHQSESVTCPACRAVNQVLPEGVVSMYFAAAPHAFAEEAAFQRRQAVTQFRRQVEAQRAAEAARGGGWPEEGIQSLKQWEAMERDYWTAYTAVKARCEPMTPEEQQKFIESRMRQFIESLERNPVWRKAHGMPT